MSHFLDHLKTSPLLADGATGSYLFERTGRLSEMNHVYEAFNADRPEQILQVHLAYLQAGARCLTTNTFGANPTHLVPVDQGSRVAELNRAGVRVARRAIDAYREQTGNPDDFFVIGSVGPAREDIKSAEGIAELYQEQFEALASEGIDAILLETFTSLAQIDALVRQLQSLAPDLPTIIHMALHQTADGAWNQDPRQFVETAVDLGIPVVGTNCCAPWEAEAFLDAVENLEAVREGEIQLSVMPNGGDFQRIGHRFLTGVNPEFMGRFARDVANRGVRLIGGCCEVHPPHINEMHNYLQSRQVGGPVVQVVESSAALQPTGDAVKKGNGRLSQKLMTGEFAVSVEMLPSRGTGGLKSKIDFVAELAASGLADALDLTDGSRGIPLMPPGDLIGVIRERLGWSAEDRLEMIPHFTARDLNVMGLQSRLIGYWARHIHNVLFVTGDPPKMSPTYPRSTAVFDLDSVAMIRYAHSFLNAGVDFGGQPLGKQKNPRTRFTIGSGFEPEAVDLEREIEKLERKIDSGVDYIMTQPAFRFEPLETVAPFRDRTAFLIGVLILTSLGHAQRMAQVPGVIVPNSVFARMEKFEGTGDQAKVGQEVAVEQVRWIKEQGWSGLYLMSPSTHKPVLDVLVEGLS
jgi:methionine synthase / methylenetetrahydrofolate reductase(NADPH)